MYKLSGSRPVPVSGLLLHIALPLGQVVKQLRKMDFPLSACQKSTSDVIKAPIRVNIFSGGIKTYFNDEHKHFSIVTGSWWRSHVYL